MEDGRGELEMALIGTLIKAPENIDLAASRLRKSDFLVEVHGRAFEHIVLLREARKPVDDHRFLMNSMLAAGIIGEDSIGSITVDDLVAAIEDAVPPHVGHYCEQIISWAMLFEERKLVFDMQDAIERRDADPVEICQKMQSRLEAIAARDTLKTRSIFEHSRDYIEKLKENRNHNRQRGLPTGIPSLDLHLGGLVPGELVMICARPSHGKTALGMQIMQHNSTDGKRCLFVSMEMKGQELSERMLIRESNVASERLRSVHVTDEEMTRLEQAAIEHRVVGLEVYDEGKAGVRQVRALAKLMQATGGIDLLAIDYLQIMKPMDFRKPTNEQIRDSAEGLKDIAKELDIPVLCLAQLNRKADSERPAPSHIKGSGDAEQAADVIVLIHNPHPENEADKREIRRAELILGKVRGSGVGSFIVNWSPSETMFFDV